MYIITAYNDGIPTIVHDRFERIANGKIVREVNAIDSLSFGIYPSNPGYDLIFAYSTTFSVLDVQTGDIEFEGRVVVPAPSVDSSGVACKSVTCEGVTAYLRDSTQPYLDERQWDDDASRTGLQKYVDFLLENHNARVEERKRIYRGTVDLKTYETSGGVYKGVNRERTWDVLKSKLIDVFGGEMRVRRGDDGLLYLDYSDMLGKVRSTGVRIARNIDSCGRECDPNRLITRLRPLGCKLKAEVEDEAGNLVEKETEDRLTIASANAGTEYIDDKDAIEAYGIIEGTNVWDDVTQPEILKVKAEEWMGVNNRLPVSTRMTAYDLSLIGLDPDRLRVHDWYHCFNPLVGLDEKLEIVKQAIDVNEPQKSTIDLGESTTMQSKKIADLKNLAGEVEYIKSQSKTNVININNSIKATMSAIAIAEDRIVATVGEQIYQTSERIDGEITMIRSSVSTLEQTAKSIRADVTVLTEDQRVLQSQIELLPNSIISTVTESYEKYVNGEIKTVNTSISEIRQSVKSISLMVADLTDDQATIRSQIEMLPGSITSTVTQAYKTYVNGEIKTVNESITSIQQTVDSISLNVSGSLGGSASIVLSVDGATQSGRVDLSGVRNAFKNDTTAITITAGTVTFNSNTFVVNSSYFKVTNTGVITATSGTIGGFTLTSTTLYNGKNSLTSDAYGVYLSGSGMSVGNGSTFTTLSNGHIYGGKNGDTTGYVSFNNYWRPTGVYGTRIAGRGCISLLTDGSFGIGSYYSFGSEATITVGQSKTITFATDLNLEFKYSTMTNVQRTDGSYYSSVEYISGYSWNLPRSSVMFTKGLMTTS